MYQCFCSTASFSEAIFDQSHTCYDFVTRNQVIENFGIITGLYITFLIFVINYLNYWLVRKIGFNYESGKNQAFMNSILFSQFMVGCLLILFADLNLEDTPLDFLPIRGSFKDTSPAWYYLVAPSILYTMIILSVFPYLSFIMVYIKRKWLWFYDIGFTCCYKNYNTKKVTIEQYIELHSGPDFEIYLKYTYITTPILLAFIYGPAIPLLFPVCLFCLANHYIVERLSLAYFYRKPPKYDNLYGKISVRYLSFGPMLMLLFGYWWLGNSQIFSNKWAELTNRGDIQDP